MKAKGLRVFAVLMIFVGIIAGVVALILAGTYTIDDVPNISNLREVVQEVLDEQEDGEE